MITMSHQNEQDVIRTCGYIKDDQYIASVYGISIQKVRRLREKVPKKKLREVIAFQQNAEPINLKESDRWNQNMMEQGSQKLLDALIEFFKERERKLRHAPKS